MPSPDSRALSELDRLKLFVRRHSIPVAIFLVLVLVVVPILVYYSMSYNSVNGTTVQLATGYRSPGYGYVNTFYLEIHVWSSATSLDTHVNSPTFTLAVDSFPFGTVTAGDGPGRPAVLSPTI